MKKSELKAIVKECMLEEAKTDKDTYLATAKANLKSAINYIDIAVEDLETAKSSDGSKLSSARKTISSVLKGIK